MHFTRLGTTPLRMLAALALLGWSAHGVAQQPAPEPPPATDAPPAETPAAEPGAVEAAPGEAEAGVEATAAGEVTADEAAAEAPARGGDESGEIIVTGTRIKRTQTFALPASVAVADRKELAQTGANNMADVVRNMSVNYGSDLNTDVSTNSGGTSQFNLRGLGLSSTLVLLNGRRLVVSGALSIDGASFVDTSTLPLQAVERIEVLKGGASAIYGSDAVAGVVNIITRKRMNGFEAQAGYQTTGAFDQHEWDVSLVGGAQGETTRVMGMAAYMKREPMTADKRSFTEAEVPSPNSSLSSYPSVFIPISPGGAPFRDPGCGDPVNGPLTNLEMTASGAPQCRFTFNRYFHLVPDEQRFNTYLTIEQDIGQHTMAFVEAGYSRNRVFRILSPSLALLNPLVVPAAHEWNPTGALAAWQGRIRGGAYPPWNQNFDSDTLHSVAGVKGDLGGIAKEGKLSEWTWELAGTWSATRYRQSADDTTHVGLQSGLNSCDPTSPTYNPANCYNPFSFGPRNSTELYNRINTQVVAQQDNELSTLTLDFSGPLMTLPGGDLSIAVGAQVRRDVGISDPDHTLNTGDAEFASRAPDWRAERRIWAGYGEISAPFVQGLEVQAAGRLEQYSDVGTSGFNPMLGATWTPALTFNGDGASQFSRLRLRGTYATSFVAPSLLQAQGVQNVSTPLRDVDPVTMMPAAGTNYVTVRVLGNQNLEPQTSKAFTVGLEWPAVKGFNLALDYWNYDFQKIIVAPDAQNLINTMPADPRIQRLNGVVQAVEIQFENATSVTTHGLDLDVTYRGDLGLGAGSFSLGASGTYVLSYDIPRRYFGRAPSPDANCTGNGPDDTCDVAGVRNRTNFARAIPRLRFNVPLSWSLAGHSASVIAHYIGAYQDEFYQVPAAKGGPTNPMMAAMAPFVDIKAWLTLDLQYSYRISEGDKAATTFRVGVNNLFDTDPPFVPGAGFGFDTETHDPRGRLLYARLIQEL
jgi:iron complex outermembrane receptor protein